MLPGRGGHTWENNIKMHLKDKVDRIQLAQLPVHWHVFVNTLRLHFIKAGNFMALEYQLFQER
jgi:hypothetical protein